MKYVEVSVESPELEMLKLKVELRMIVTPMLESVPYFKVLQGLSEESSFRVGDIAALSLERSPGSPADSLTSSCDGF